MLNALIMPLIFLAMLAFVAAAEKGCDWYWGRKRRKARPKYVLSWDRVTVWGKEEKRDAK